MSASRLAAALVADSLLCSGVIRSDLLLPPGLPPLGLSAGFELKRVGMPPVWEAMRRLSRRSAKFAKFRFQMDVIVAGSRRAAEFPGKDETLGTIKRGTSKQFTRAPGDSCPPATTLPGPRRLSPRLSQG